MSNCNEIYVYMIYFSQNCIDNRSIFAKKYMKLKCSTSVLRDSKMAAADFVTRL